MIMKRIPAIALTVLLAVAGAQSAVRNEWTFETDGEGVTLSGAVNTGADSAAFEPGGSGCFEADGSGALLSTPDEASLWDIAAELDADVSDASSGVRYLRCDVSYDLSNDDSLGTSFGISFVDGSGTNITGIMLAHNADGSREAPPGKEISPISEPLALQGIVSVIAKVDLNARVMTVWYDASGGNHFEEASPATGTEPIPISIASIHELRVQTTGNVRSSDGGGDDLWWEYSPESSSDTDFSRETVAVKNIRTADSWEVITAPLADYSQPPQVSLVSITDQLGGTMEKGQVNTVTVVINNAISPASGLVCALTHNGNPGDLTIVSSDPIVTVGPNQTITNTFTVTANADGRFDLTAQATVSGVPTGEPASLTVTVGAWVEYSIHSLESDSGGNLPGRIEPDESIELRVTSINSGTENVGSLTSRLIPENPQYFSSISPASRTLRRLSVGQTFTVTYEFSCSEDIPDGLQTFYVVSTTADREWVSSFTIDIVSRALPSISPNSVEIHVAPGQTNSASVILANNGNKEGEFHVTAEGLPEEYLVAQVYQSRRDVFPATSTFSRWNDAGTWSAVVGGRVQTWQDFISDPMPIGFDFRLFGGEMVYTEFSVLQHGRIVLGPMSGQGSTTLIPFANSQDIDPATIRYEKGDGWLCVAWGHNTGQEFQALLKADGTIRYFYEAGTWDAGFIGLENKGILYDAIDHIPGQIPMDCIQLFPKPWVSYDLTSGEVSPGGSVPLTFTVDASEQDMPSTNDFTANVEWDLGSGATETFPVKVTVIVDLPSYDLSAPSEFSFSGPAGLMSPDAVLTVTNSGNVPLDYAIADIGQAAGAYVMQNVSPQWQDFPGVNETTLTDDDLDDGLVVDIGFPFVFFGTTYTQVMVDEDGTLTFDDGVTAVPFSAGLRMDLNSRGHVSTARERNSFQVTWENMLQPGGGADQSFQAILNRDDRSIRFNYRPLGENWMDGVIELTGAGIVDGTLVNDQTVDTTPVYVYETNLVTEWWSSEPVEEVTLVGTNYVTTAKDPAPSQSLQFIPGEERVISFSPVSGTIPVDGTADIILKGNATDLLGGDVSETTLRFVHPGGSNQVAVIFTVTDSVAASSLAPALSAAAWGTAEPVHFDLVQNSDGSRSLSWPGATHDDLSRIYIIEYTAHLGSEWIEIARETNVTGYHDNDPGRNAAPVIFYRVSVAF